MAVHEIKKCAKVIDEVSTYLMREGFEDFGFKIHRDDTETQIKINLGVCSKNLINKFTTAIESDMDDDIEEYCWELLGESDTNDELSVVGMLIDKIEIDADETGCHIILHRYYN